MNTIIKPLAVAALILSLAACGGSGGGGSEGASNSSAPQSLSQPTLAPSSAESSPSEAYSGPTYAASLDLAAAQVIVEDIFSGQLLSGLEKFSKPTEDQAAAPELQAMASVLGVMSKLVTRVDFSASGVQKPTSSGLRKIDIDSVSACESGSFHMLGELDDNGVGTVDVTLSNCQFDNLRLDGGDVRFTMDAFDFDLLLPTLGSMSFVDVNATLGEEQLILSGVEDFELNVSMVDVTTNSVFNMVVHRLSDQTMLWFSDFSTETQIDISSEQVDRYFEGRIYHSGLGFTDVGMGFPLRTDFFNNSYEPPYDTGLIRFVGANESRIEFEASPEAVSVSIYESNAGAAVSSYDLSWSEFILP